MGDYSLKPTRHPEMRQEARAFLDMTHPDKLSIWASTCIIPLYQKLTENGFDVTVSHPRKTRLIAEARIISDRVDSRALAERVCALL